ncbi:MAG: hypothetical protein E7I45_12395, partial [Eikenella corrodens]|uniref:hypothetical protein n=1 Tax=Eikenella corrodens TaxID=539 RepID=UPI002912AAE8
PVIQLATATRAVPPGFFYTGSCLPTLFPFSGSLSQYAGYLKTWLQRSYSELQLRMLLPWLALLHYRYDLRLATLAHS